MAIHGYKGGVISATAPTVSPSSASGVWTLEDQLQNSAEWPITNTLLSNSVRTRASATAYMSRTPTVAGNRRTFTWSAWVKRGDLVNTVMLYSARIDDANRDNFYFDSNGALVFQHRNNTGGANTLCGTVAVFRDPSSWYHVVYSIDTTQATDTNRVKIYVNGVQQTLNGTYPAQNETTTFNNNCEQRIGLSSTSTSYFDGYLADINNIDGQALTPNYFGATNPNTGVWQPAQFHGTYGTNGFYLPMNIEQLQASFTRSLRFRASNSAYLSKTFSTSGTNNKIQTFSFWVKLGSLASGQYSILTGYDGSSSNNAAFSFWNNVLRLDFGGALQNQILTTQVFRDPSAWYHVVLAIDTTQATASNRIKIYVNGSQITSFSTATYPSQNAASQFIGANANNKIGTWWNNSYDFFDGYLAEVNFIDGLALEPNLFGTVDATSGAWVPVTYAGSYGTNGFYLPFTNNTSTTTLGYDFSGLGNNWTANNFSLTAGSTYDSMTDVPTLTSATAANFANINPLDNYYCGGTITNGNLQLVTGSSSIGYVRGTLGVTSGKWYFEAVANATSSANTWYDIGWTGSACSSTTNGLGNNADDIGYLGQNGAIRRNGSEVSSGTTYTTGDTIGVMLDLDNNLAYFSKNGTLINGGTGYSVPAVTSTSTGAYYPAFGDYDNSGTKTWIVNFGQQPFTYTPPTGYVALNTYNM